MRTLVKTFGGIPCGVAVVTTIGEVLVTFTMSSPRLQKRKNRSTFGCPPACVVLGTTRNSGISWSPERGQRLHGQGEANGGDQRDQRVHQESLSRAARHRCLFPDELASRSVTTRLLRFREDFWAPGCAAAP